MSWVMASKVRGTLTRDGGGGSNCRSGRGGCDRCGEGSAHGGRPGRRRGRSGMRDVRVAADAGGAGRRRKRGYRPRAMVPNVDGSLGPRARRGRRRASATSAATVDFATAGSSGLAAREVVVDSSAFTVGLTTLVAPSRTRSNRRSPSPVQFRWSTSRG